MVAGFDLARARRSMVVPPLRGSLLAFAMQV